MYGKQRGGSQLFEWRVPKVEEYPSLWFLCLHLGSLPTARPALADQPGVHVTCRIDQ